MARLKAYDIFIILPLLLLCGIHAKCSKKHCTNQFNCIERTVTLSPMFPYSFLKINLEYIPALVIQLLSQNFYHEMIWMLQSNKIDLDIVVTFGLKFLSSQCNNASGML